MGIFNYFKRLFLVYVCLLKLSFCGWPSAKLTAREIRGNNCKTHSKLERDRAPHAKTTQELVCAKGKGAGQVKNVVVGGLEGGGRRWLCAGSL